MVQIWAKDQLIQCAVARTASEQSKGLQGHPGLSWGEGMLFPFHVPRRATFHMGTVDFPIDILFLGPRGQVQKVVEARPGDRSKWSCDRTAAVLELPGGFCRRVGINAGDRLTYDQPKTIQRELVDEGDRMPPNFRYPRGLPDNDWNSLADTGDGAPRPFEPAMSGNPAWDQTMGYDVGKPMREPGDHAVRTGAKITDAGTFTAILVDAIASDRHGLGGLEWRQNVDDGGLTDSAIVTLKDIEWWLRAAPEDVREAATSPEGLVLFADALSLLGVIQQGRVEGDQIHLIRPHELETDEEIIEDAEERHDRMEDAMDDMFMRTSEEISREAQRRGTRREVVKKALYGWDLTRKDHAYDLGSDHPGTAAIFLTREALSEFDLPGDLQLHYQGMERSAGGGPHRIHEGCIWIGGSMKSASGVRNHFEIPITVQGGRMLHPGLLRHNGQVRVMAQSSFDEILFGSEIYEPVPDRKNMYSLPPAGGISPEQTIRVQDHMFSNSPRRTRGHRRSGHEDRNSLGPALRESMFDPGDKVKLKHDYYGPDRGGTLWLFPKGLEGRVCRDMAGDDHHYVVDFGEDAGVTMVPLSYLK